MEVDRNVLLHLCLVSLGRVRVAFGSVRLACQLSWGTLGSTVLGLANADSDDGLDAVCECAQAICTCAREGG